MDDVPLWVWVIQSVVWCTAVWVASSMRICHSAGCDDQLLPHPKWQLACSTISQGARVVKV
jgi:hypothetical protein